MYKVFSHKKAVKYYQGLDSDSVRRINTAIEFLSKNPFEGPHIKRLRGRLDGKYRFAAGDLRIVWWIRSETRFTREVPTTGISGGHQCPPGNRSNASMISRKPFMLLLQVHYPSVGTT